jgi:hypothetical protein
MWPRVIHAKPLHPTLDAQDINRLRQNLEPVLKLSDAETLRLIPERAGLLFVACPNCNGGAQEGQIAWDIAHPDEVYCKFCNLHYPNDQYPDTHILRVTNPVGQIHEYPYWENSDGYRIFFRAKGWYLAREYFARAAHQLAQLYHATKEQPYAQRAALILDRFAQVYPGYCVHYDYPFKQKIFYSGDQTFPYPVPDYRAAKWSWWAYMDIPENLILAYDLIKNSGALSVEQKTRIENDFFRASVNFVRSYPPALTNMDPTMLRGLIAAGRVLPDPEYIHDAVRRIGLLVQKQFFADGVWREGAISYHNQTIHGLDQLIHLLDGYTDPDGYQHPNDEPFKNLSLSEQFPILKKAQQVPEMAQYPNGHFVAFHDTWAREKKDPLFASIPYILPAFGHACLGRGEGTHQMQLHLHFSGGYGHQHADLLNLTLFSHGRERLSDIGYTHTRHRAWTIGTLSHNTVTVNGKDQNFGSERHPSDGNLLLFIPGDDTFQAVEADGHRAYPDMDVYRRLLLLIGVSPTDAYAVDLFQVVGGERHEYILTGDADSDGAITHDLAKMPYGPTLLPEGITATLPTGESVPGDAQGHNIGYAYIRQVEQAAVTSSWIAQFTSAETPDGAVRLHSLTHTDGTLFTAQAPSIRRAQENDALLDSLTMPVLLHRREGSHLSSHFVHVIEPFATHPFLSRTERLSTDRPETLALKITGRDFVDYILLSQNADRAWQVGDLHIQGKIGFVRQQNGQTQRMTLIGGTHLSTGSTTLTGHGVIRANITGLLHKKNGNAVNGLVLDQVLPSHIPLRGLTAILHDGAGFTHGYEIADITQHNGHTVLCIEDDPGFDMLPDGSSCQTYFPGRSWTGQNRIEITTVQTYTK